MPEDKNQKQEKLKEEKPFLSEEDIQVLKENTLKLFNAADQNLFIHQCQITRLHPLTGQIWARPERETMDQNGKWAKMIVVTGIQGILSVADRSGVYDGSSPIEWCAKNGEWVDVWLQSEPPFAARATTWRKDRTRPEVAIVRWKAVANETWKSDRNFWTKMPDYMIGKCALAASLRKLFPNLLSGLYESSEIDGGISDMVAPGTTLEQDVRDQEARIANEEAAAERLKSQGVSTVAPSAPSGPAFPARDAAKEVEPAKGLEPKEPDDLDMSAAPSGSDGQQRPPDWWKYLSCDPIKASAYLGKQVSDLTPSLLRQAAEKWVPKVRAKWNDTTQQYRDLAEAMEIAWEEAQAVMSKGEARAAAAQAEGAQ